MAGLLIDKEVSAGQAFVGRKNELKKLSANFILQTNTAIVAPRGWGKSSLVIKAAAEAFRKEKTFRLCHVDLSDVSHEEQFYNILVRSVLVAVSDSQADVISAMRKFLPGMNPKISFVSDSPDDLIVDIGREDITEGRKMITDMPYTVAKETGLKIVVCIDDFHRISRFSQSDEFVSFLESRWKGHSGVTYCVTGEGNSMFEKFLKTSPMFYRYGEVIRLGAFDASETIAFLRDRFADNAKYLDNEIAALIIDKVKGNPFYLFRLAHMSWLGTSVVCSREVVEEAFRTMTDQMCLVFENMTNSLTVQQLCYLHAVSSGETVISTSEVMHRYHITSPTSASRSKAALLESGMICVMDGRVCFADPVYEYWLKHRFFNMKKVVTFTGRNNWDI